MDLFLWNELFSGYVASVVERFLRSFNVHSHQCSGNMHVPSFSEGKPEKVHLQWKFFFDWAGLNVEDLMFDLSFNANYLRWIGSANFEEHMRRNPLLYLKTLKRI